MIFCNKKKREKEKLFKCIVKFQSYLEKFDTPTITNNDQLNFVNFKLPIIKFGKRIKHW